MQSKQLINMTLIAAFTLLGLAPVTRAQTPDEPAAAPTTQQPP